MKLTTPLVTLNKTRAMTQISFARGFPGPDLLPLEEFGECAKAALARDGATAMNYRPPLGYPPLREWIADRHDVPVEV